MDILNEIMNTSRNAETSEADSIYETAQKFYKGTGVAKDYSEARRLYKEAADKGHSDSAFKLGQIYLKGLGTEKDPDLAVEWYRKAADAGHSQALFTLADLYFKGEVIERDIFKAKELFESLVETGGYNKSEAFSKLYDIRQELGSQMTVKEARKLLGQYEKEAEEQQSTSAMLKIAIMCLEGKETKKDLNEAEYWAEKAWERGNTSGAYVMGLIKEEEHNLSSSAIWFKKGSGKSDGDCCLRYGLCFLDGKGVERNVQEALFFIEQARHLKLKYCKQFEIFNAYTRAKEASGS